MPDQSQFRCLALGASLAICASAMAQAPTLLFDINQEPALPRNSSPSGFARLGNQVLFAATTLATGTELWVMDLGTGATSLVLDILPGTLSSAPRELVTFGGYVYFFADDGVAGEELWRSDGTAAGTTLAIDLNGNLSSEGTELLVGNNRLLYRATTASGIELVSSDGTQAGTVVIDINATGDSTPRLLTVIGSEVWFQAYTGSFGSEPWRTDGTVAGTVLVADLTSGPSGSSVRGFVEVGGQAVFLAADGLWQSDGTPAGTSSLAGVARHLTTAGGLAWFTVGLDIWSTDGTAANTQQQFSVPAQPGSLTAGIVGFGSHLAITTTAGQFDPNFLWLSDGSAAGTFQVAAEMRSVATDGNTLWFAGEDALGDELWRTDGTAAGTFRVADAVPGAEGLGPTELFVVAPGDLIFSGSAPVFGREPWRSNGTTAGAVMIANIADENGSTADGWPLEFVDAAGIAYFSATDGSGRTLWRTDGTGSGTDYVVPPGPSQPRDVGELVSVGDRLFFGGNTPGFGRELMVTDGTAAGTYAIDTNLSGNGDPTHLVAAGDRLYFQSYNPAGGRSLWQTDGTTTVAITGQIGQGSIGSMAALGRGLVFGFHLSGSGQGSEPYYTDGTVAGTVMLGDLRPGGGSSLYPYNPLFPDIVTLGDRCFFRARTGSGDIRIFATDGTPAGTVDLLAGTPGIPTSVHSLTVVRDRLFFVAQTSAFGWELWVSDGTAAGTQMVLDATPGPASSPIYEMTAAGDLLLYTMEGPGIAGTWRSDGTAAGTFELVPLVGDEFVAAGDRLAYFRAFDRAHGPELWRTDGTVAGTALHVDLRLGHRGSIPSNFVLSRGRLLFTAFEDQVGLEPWVMDLHATNQPTGYGCSVAKTAPRLWCDDPVLGGTTTFEVRNGPVVGLSVPLLSNHTASQWPLGPPGCDLFVDPSALVMDVQVFLGGSAAHQLAVPSTPALDGMLFRVQVLTLAGSGVLELGLSNAVTLALGL